MADCSPLKLVVQEFFSTTNCRGPPFAEYKYPIERECLRYSNGTQIFFCDPKYINVTEIDFQANQRCDGLQIKYVMKLNLCYQLYGNRGFRWRTDGDFLFSAAPRGFELSYLLLSLSAIVSVALAQRKGELRFI